MGSGEARGGVGRRAWIAGALLGLTGLGALAGSGALDPLLYRAEPRAPTILFVVLDTVRADRLSACGNDRPTSPRLEQMVRDGAWMSCEAAAPASWTLPSHASFFTGTELPDHGIGMVSDGDAVLPWGSKLEIRSFETDRPTLAEQLAARGYQTAALSANPVVGPTTGLLRGFDLQRVGGFRGDALDRELRELLTEVDGERPLFLYVNIIDAHDPWPAIPDDVGWLPPRDAIRMKQWDRSAPLNHYVSGRMPEDEAAAFAEHLVDVYDYAVWHADTNLGRVLDTLTDYGWLTDDSRIVVTSDHGEYLGEHGHVGHSGALLHEPVTRVPLLVKGARGPLPPTDAPISALSAYDLVLDGQLGPERAPRTAAFPNPKWRSWFGIRSTTPAGALRVGHEKLVRVDGRTRVYDLRADPGEQHPRDGADHPADQPLTRFVDRTIDAWRRPAPKAVDAQEQLRALGYVE